eukprot:6334121-Pyramimonas_sp.AAC.1
MEVRALLTGMASPWWPRHGAATVVMGTSAPAAHSPIDSCGEFIMYQDAGVRLPGHDGAWPTRALPLACNCRHISYRVLASALCSDFGIE